MRLFHYKVFVLPAILSLLAAAGCSKSLNLQVEADVPTPLTTQIPLTAGVYYNDNFRNYVFKEDTESRKNWTIDTRQSRIYLFDNLLPSMFRAVKPVDNIPAGGEAVDIILEPDVIEMQVALPEETHSDMYEAWVKYAVKMYQPTGDVISDWQITGYGKAHTSLFTNNKEGLDMAINLALRDIGAKLVLGLPKAPGVRDWLDNKIDCAAYNGLC
jgi:hypothetical protein